MVNSLPPPFTSPSAFYSEFQYTLICSLLSFGGLLGSNVGGFVADRCGRKPCLIFATACYTIGIILQSVTPSAACFILGRLCTGVGAGINTVVIPLYLGEVAPIEYRGSLGICNQLFIVLGLLLIEV